ncbi:hypothetical protein ACH5Y9_01150 [Methylomonas sp. BW4-1]|uniref:hypothetical protein n=1 Tax=Methylomonas sp. BW4-1 TaxID=3376685 RepID=UPI004042E203
MRNTLIEQVKINVAEFKETRCAKNKEIMISKNSNAFRNLPIFSFSWQEYMNKLSLLVLYAHLIMFAGCAVPRDAVLLFDKPNPGSYEGKVTAVPDGWMGRMLMVSATAILPTVGGVEMHSHGIGHVHEGRSGATNMLERPLGIKETVADGQHVHALVSVSTSPGTSTLTSGRPKSYGLSAFLFDGLFSYSMPEGLIVGYIGRDLPEGWRWCDGANKTPDLRERFLSITPPAGAQGDTNHTHNIEHTHTWKAGANQDRPAFAGDITSPRLPIAQFQARIHEHESLEKGGTTVVNEVANEPQFIGIRFIQAEQYAKLPTGTVLLLANNKIPDGWDLLSTQFDGSIENRYVKALLSDEPMGVLGGNKIHSHKFTSTHTVELLPINDIGVVDSARNGPKLAINGHGHNDISVGVEADSTPAENAPTFVKLTAVVKQ